METLRLKQGIKNKIQKGYETIYSEMIQLNQITSFKPIKVADLNTR